MAILNQFNKTKMGERAHQEVSPCCSSESLKGFRCSSAAICSPRFNPSITEAKQGSLEPISVSVEFSFLVWEHPWLLKSASVSIMLDTRITCMLCDYLYMCVNVCMQVCIICMCVAISGFLFVLAFKFYRSKSVTLVSSCCLVKLCQWHFSEYFNIKRSKQIALLCGVSGVPSLIERVTALPQMGVPGEKHPFPLVFMTWIWKESPIEWFLSV